MKNWIIRSVLRQCTSSFRKSFLNLLLIRATLLKFFVPSTYQIFGFGSGKRTERGLSNQSKSFIFFKTFLGCQFIKDCDEVFQIRYSVLSLFMSGLLSIHHKRRKLKTFFKVASIPIFWFCKLTKIELHNSRPAQFSVLSAISTLSVM